MMDLSYICTKDLGSDPCNPKYFNIALLFINK